MVVWIHFEIGEPPRVFEGSTSEFWTVRSRQPRLISMGPPAAASTFNRGAQSKTATESKGG